MAFTAAHCNGNVIAVVDTETTGLRPTFHEIWQIAVVPLDSKLQPHPALTPFHLKMHLDHPERVEAKDTHLTKQQYIEIQKSAINHDSAADIFYSWFEELGLAPGKRLMPLAQNWAFDYGFIRHWLGDATMSAVFDGRYRDLMCCTLFENDQASFQVADYPFAKNNLSYVCNCLGVTLNRAHDALEDAVATAECYRRMCESRTR